MSEDLWSGTPGQSLAVAQLQAAVANPVHAYLLLGPAGAGTRSAARSFAAALLCPDGGCGTCNHCTRAMALHHPDLIVPRHDGPGWRVDEIREIAGQAQRRPLEAARTVILLADAHLLGGAAPALLKTLEEPPVTTTFILLADDLPRSLETIRSRCAEVRFELLNQQAIVEILEHDGLDPQRAAEIAEGAAGDAIRARLLVADPGFASRLARWRGVPQRLDGTGRTVVAIVEEIQASLDEAVAPLVAQHVAELAELDTQAKELGLRVSGRKELLDHHKREIRAYREGEIRAGLGVLARAYRVDLAAAVAAGDDPAVVVAMARVDAISRYVTVMRRNPRPSLSLERLLLALC